MSEGELHFGEGRAKEMERNKNPCGLWLAATLPVVLIACVEGSDTADPIDDAPANVLRLQEDLETKGLSVHSDGIRRTADGGREWVSSDGIFRPDPRTPEGEEIIRTIAIGEGLSMSEVELLLLRMKEARNDSVGDEYVWEPERATPLDSSR